MAISESDVTRDESNKQSSHGHNDGVLISKPLVAVACMSQNDNDKDRQAKHNDYANTLLTLNAQLGFESVYQVLDEAAANGNDFGEEKKLNASDASNASNTSNTEDAPVADTGDEPTYRIEHVTQKLSEERIKNAKYKMQWKYKNQSQKETAKDNENENENKNEEGNDLLLFCKEVVSLLEDEVHGYDGLIFVLTGHAKIDQMTRGRDRGFWHISDSYGNSISLAEIYTLFDKNHSKFGWFPIIFMVDRYMEMSANQIEDSIKRMKRSNKNENDSMASMASMAVVKYFNRGYRRQGFQPMSVYNNVIFLIQYYGDEKPYAIHGTNGGMVTRSIRHVFSRKPQDSTHLRELLTECDDYVRQNGLGAYPTRGDLGFLTPKIRLSPNFWK